MRRAAPPPARPAARRTLAGLATTAVALGLVQTAPAAADHTGVPSRVTLMGSLQSELGCAADWDEACTATDLTALAGSPGVFETVEDVPAGAYEYKVRLDGSWEESYGRGQENAPLVLEAPARLRFTYDHAAHAVSVAPAQGQPGLQPGDAALAGDSLREDLTRERFYFVMADRFENGDPANDTGGYGDDRLTSGYDPTHKGFYHGGDLKGIIDRLDYIEGLGTTAIWLTPSFKNKPVQGEGANTSAGYHGYWITDFTQIDPHLGTNEELEQLVDQAHARGIKVFFDIITNHTADVISYAEGSSDYITRQAEPYRDADGNPFDDRDFAGTEVFPALDPLVSFPYTPVVAPAEAQVKVPAWLNDPTLYHNRGNALFNGGESDQYGDFVGLDDLFTEHPQVVDGMTDVYRAWVDFGIDGFRIDTVKHVNTEFWQEFAPAIQEQAEAAGNEDFFAFGEVYDADPEFLSQYTTEAQLQATLDFGFQARAQAFGNGAATRQLQDFYALDDHYTDADSNAYSLPTFLGNHDMGRIGMFLREGGAEGEELLQRDRLAHALMYLTRGQPVVYYGDEQGFTGDGGDQDARQDVFPSQVATYNDDDLIGTDATTAQSNFDPEHPMYRWLAELSALREAHPTLADGAQVHRYASDGAGVYAFSRIDDADDREYLVAVNNAEQAQTVTFDTFNERRVFKGLWPAGTARVRSTATGEVTVTVPPLSAVVWRAAAPLAKTEAAPQPVFTSGGTAGGRAEVGVDVPGGGFDEVTFAYRPAGTEDWTVLGTDDNAPYRVFHDVRDLPQGSVLEYRAVLQTHSGDLAAAGTSAVVGPEPAAAPEPAVQPGAVSVPGSLGTEMGCAADWDPQCPQAQMTLDPASGLWTLTTDLPAGSYEYKVAIDGAWEENYGAGGARNGANIALQHGGGPITFAYDHATHLVTTSP
ncbi:alpha-amylase family glycosyl hydrolase [Quadrisphaera sp. DSM 44207]|uniref:alpha-amylase family glycosyl hydrolase n=1 Tax=Quadrisphaera sp. DSM 44207 TaxID=1881057 RepID=UPI00088241C8|nr:alpha-amylase family glycosyl hydrolase [Quadrisphaera sp. DSM 44207]SDQ15761.1 Glycosidase [Quadrisphaera sp. DSM 44207]